MGRPAVFLRFAGCNLWNGLERDRAEAICNFCDTDFIGTDGTLGGKFSSADDLALACLRQWRKHAQAQKPFIVCTGGEPLLQLDTALIEALHEYEFEIAVETNGTIQAPEGIDWICVSPKSEAPLRQTFGSELKLVYPQPLAPPEKFEELSFAHFFLQPMDGNNLENNITAAIAYCQAHPKWRLGVQLHKILGIA